VARQIVREREGKSYDVRTMGEERTGGGGVCLPIKANFLSQRTGRKKKERIDCRSPSKKDEDVPHHSKA